MLAINFISAFNGCVLVIVLVYPSYVVGVGTCMSYIRKLYYIEHL